ncbi:MAG: hypothetical protein HKL88_08305 [Bacteroidia bacterium]|nr:hypothetical protein [Bacteroidia bacterium]
MNVGKINLPFWLLAAAAIIGLTLPGLIQDGMFMDAMLYTSVSHNLSQGIGTFWFPQFSYRGLSGLSSFHEQPPLVFGIQALFFKILGNGMYTERIYTFTTTCLSAWLINILWKDIYNTDNTALKKMGWLPVILWITVPICFWSYSYNMQENTMGIFTLASVIFACRAVRSQEFKPSLYIAGGLFLFLATLSKGVPGLFPLSIPLLYLLTTGKSSFRRMLYGSAVLIAVPVMVYGILLLYRSSRESLSLYFFYRLIGRIHDEPTVSNRLTSLWMLINELIPQMAVTLLVFILTGFRRAKTFLNKEKVSDVLFFITVGLSGSVPLMLTLVQKSFYLVPSIPYFAVAAAIIMAPLLQNSSRYLVFSGKWHKALLRSSTILVVFAIIISVLQAGKVRREKDVLDDVYQIGKVVPRFSVITIPADMWNEWELQSYLMRYYNISIDPDVMYQYYLTDSKLKSPIPAPYVKVDAGLGRYSLYRRKN